MTELETKLYNLQFQIDEINTGYCIAFKLINYDELNVITSSHIQIIEVLDKIIKEVCNALIPSSNSNVNILYKQIEVDRILLVLPIDKELTQELALQTYLLTQIYTDNTWHELYINCSIASIAFPKASKDAKEIWEILNWLLSDQSSQAYYQEYDAEQYNIELLKQSNIELNLLRKAVANKTMVFAYQPIIDRKTMKTKYYECLLRIPDAKNNLISAGSIIPEAERKGLIFIIDKIVLEMAIKELASNQNLHLAVNISNIGLLDPPLLILAEKLLQIYDVGGRLIIEITETTLNQNYQQIASFMLKLRKFGCKFALDDFGSGFTSFYQLQHLPIDIIKIDGSYVRNLISDVQSQDFITRLIKIAEDLGAITVAEFVENGEIAKFLIDLKIDGMQGNFFSPALINKIKD